MSGPQFIEVTGHVDGEPRIVSLACICFILKDPRDGSAVIEFTNQCPRYWCKESYEQVRLALLHTQAEPLPQMRGLLIGLLLVTPLWAALVWLLG